MNNDEIFKVLDPNSNTKLSLLKGYDLQDIINLIDNYYLIYRKKLGLDKKITFGFELEVEKANESKIEKEIDNLSLDNIWKVSHDSSLDHGVEIISSILKDKIKTWEELNSICNILSNNANVGKTTGSHIHIGSQILGNKKRNWLNFIKMWSVYENIVYRFSYGEYLIGRPEMLVYSMPVSSLLKYLYLKFISEKSSLEEIIDELNHNIDKYSAISFTDVDSDYLKGMYEDNTLEYRVPNGTINPIIWQNNLNMIIKLLLYSTSSDFDLDIIEKREGLIDNEYELYDEIFLDQALEFSDLVFNNNFDKVYFLKQYLKSFEFQNYKKEYSKAKIMTK